jgi:adenine-specific DNA-methyltransferase
MRCIDEIETQRQIIQRELDLLKTQEQRNILGQFSTPTILANDILRNALKLMPTGEKIRFLDPAIGTGAFFSALNNIFSPICIEAATGYEIDKHYGKPALDLWSESILDYQLNDFTKVAPPLNESEKFNLIICNPPYVRHHHINGQKERLHVEAIAAANMKLSGLAGLYCYFMALSHRWMRSNGIAGWLIPSEFMDVNYGRAVKEYLLNEVSLLQIHRFDPKDAQFDDALVSSAVVWFQNKKLDLNHQVKFTYGGSIEHPAHEKIVSAKILVNENKWSRFPVSNEREVLDTPRLSDFFSVKRGIATGDNKYFILTKSDIESKGLPISQFKPILPSPRHLSRIEVETDDLGYPEIENKLFVLDCKLAISEVEQLYPELYAYLQIGIKIGVADRYLCKSRKLWYAQENRADSRFYCTYMGRSDKNGKKSFRFILNHSKAIVANSYLILYPKPDVAAVIAKDPEMVATFFEALNAITEKVMVDEGRVYGGGMHKLEPRELANVPAPEILRSIETIKRSSRNSIGYAVN